MVKDAFHSIAVRAGSVVVVAALLVVAPRPAGSTTLLRMSVEKMTQSAVMVVQGYVAWDYTARPDPDGPIYTYTGLEVTRCVAGPCPETVTLKHRGGTFGDLTIHISGMPRFTPGEEVLLFLEDDPEGEKDMYYTVGMIQGLFRIETDPDTGVKSAVQQLGGVTLAAPGLNGTISPVSGVEPVVTGLEALVKRIRKAWKSAGKGGAK